LIEIVDKRVCTKAEIQKLILYLSETPVRWIVDKIIGSAEVSKGYIVKRSELGAANTIWRNLGGIQSEDYYRVDQVVGVVRENRNKDNDKLLNIINEYKKMLALNDIELIITIFEVDKEHVIVDGCKRSVAFYEYKTQQHVENIRYPVYVVKKTS